MRETLIAFIKATQEQAIEKDGRFEVHMSTGPGDLGMSMQFGYGYHDGNKVLCYGPEKEEDGGRVVQVLPVEEAVGLYLSQFGVS